MMDVFRLEIMQDRSSDRTVRKDAEKLITHRDELQSKEGHSVALRMPACSNKICS